jgi:hypothetical protein
VLHQRKQLQQRLAARGIAAVSSCDVLQPYGCMEGLSNKYECM